jgi:hypothetical protein
MTDATQDNTDLRSLSAPLISPNNPKIMHLSEQNLKKLDSGQSAIHQEVVTIHNTLISRDVFFTALLFLIPILFILYFSRHAIAHTFEKFREKSVKLPDPKVVAIQEINQLDRVPASPEDLKENTFQLTEILRNYIDTRTSLGTLEKTTEEVLHDLVKDPKLSPNSKEQLEKILRETDLIKFAQYVPTTEKFQETLNTTEQFILKN